MNKNIIQQINSYKKSISEKFSDCNLVLNMLEDAQVYYGIQNKYAEFITDLSTFYKIINDPKFDIEGLKSVANTIEKSQINDELFNLLLGVIFNYLNMKKELTKSEINLEINHSQDLNK